MADFRFKPQCAQKRKMKTYKKNSCSSFAGEGTQEDGEVTHSLSLNKLPCCLLEHRVVVP